MIKPLHKNVVLKKEEVETTTASGIILTKTNQSVPCIAKVVAIGSDVKEALHINDRVVYKEYSATNVSVDHEDYMIVEAEDVLAIIE